MWESLLTYSGVLPVLFSIKGLWLLAHEYPWVAAGLVFIAWAYGIHLGHALLDIIKGDKDDK